MMHLHTSKNINRLDISYSLFRRIFNPLVKLEADYDKKLKESINCPVGHVDWEVKESKKIFATFQLPEFRDISNYRDLVLIFTL
jgi:hypothetical protein